MGRRLLQSRAQGGEGVVPNGICQPKSLRILRSRRSHVYRFLVGHRSLHGSLQLRRRRQVVFPQGERQALVVEQGSLGVVQWRVVVLRSVVRASFRLYLIVVGEALVTHRGLHQIRQYWVVRPARPRGGGGPSPR